VRKEALVAQLPARTFPHRKNRDGTYDSICSQCFQTIGTRREEKDLLAEEKAHVCAGLNLSNMYYPANLK
jgi:hypothetical protein